MKYCRWCNGDAAPLVDMDDGTTIHAACSELERLYRENAALKIELTELQARLLRTKIENVALVFDAGVAKVEQKIDDAINAFKQSNAELEALKK